MIEGTLKHGDITDNIIRGFFEVYNELGSGFLESVYENALHIVLKGYGLTVEKQKGIDVHFRGNIVGEYRADLVVNDAVVVEIKAAESIVPGHEAQLINYLKSTRLEVGLLLNFGMKPQFRRFMLDNERKQFAIRCNP
ncbi:MAG: GxxExxY protein [bacterium]|nr:GxxExxY protein [bacterium]